MFVTELVHDCCFYYYYYYYSPFIWPFEGAESGDKGAVDRDIQNLLEKEIIWLNLASLVLL